MTERTSVRAGFRPVTIVTIPIMYRMRPCSSQNSSRDHDGHVTHVANATLDFKFGLKMASDMRCCVMACEFVISSIC